MLQEEFEWAAVILCQFHVIDYLGREVAKTAYHFDSFQKLHLKNFISLMAKAQTEEEFNKYLGAVKEMCKGHDKGKQCVMGADGVGVVLHKFWEYLGGNWLNCKEMWCQYLRSHIPHLDNNTNNRLEASWKQPKEMTDPNMEMDFAFQGIVDFQMAREREYLIRVRKIG